MARMILSATAPSMGLAASMRLALITPVLVVAQTPVAPGGSAPARTCDTVYVGPSGGRWHLESNWTNGIPPAGIVPFFPGHAGAAIGENGPDLPSRGRHSRQNVAPVSKSGRDSAEPRLRRRPIANPI